MKTKITLLLAWLMICVNPCLSQQVTGMSSNDYVPQVRPIGSAQEIVAGKVVSLTFTGTTTVAGTGASGSTIWFNTGWTTLNDDSPNGVKSGRYASRFDPTIFTLMLEISSAGDSVGLATARFETAIDTANVKEGWNADLTNFFLQDGNADSSYYGQWLYEDLAKSREDNTTAGTQTLVYSLRVLHPGWIRFVFESPETLQDQNTYGWKLICKNGG